MQQPQAREQRGGGILAHRQRGTVVREHQLPLLHLVEPFKPCEPRPLPHSDSPAVQLQQVLRLGAAPAGSLAPRHLSGQVGAVAQPEEGDTAPAQVLQHRPPEGVVRPDLLVGQEGGAATPRGEPREQRGRGGRGEVDEAAFGQHEGGRGRLPPRCAEGRLKLRGLPHVCRSEVVAAARRDPARADAARPFGEGGKERRARRDERCLPLHHLCLVELDVAPGPRICVGGERPKAGVEAGAERDDLRLARPDCVEELRDD
mmetsp:Transcript_18304/g.60356  ORF Transcript_18304/g.60356 Transcript_18304/m.60356 type:complete len:259 (-) Transcript_18304:268-1044(-)